MIPRPEDFYRVLPETVWCLFGVLAMVLQPMVRSRHVLSALAFAGALLGTLATFLSAAHSGPAFNGLIQFDGYSLFFHWLIGIIACMSVLVAAPSLDREGLEPAEFYALLLFATAGMGVLASAQELLTGFIGLEMSSISSYILAGYRRDSLKSSESAMKYFLLGSFATAFFLYGIALVYGATGTTNLALMSATDSSSTLLRLGLSLILIGLGFKVAAAPFQIWTPDVYEGAPTPVTALFSAGPKAATFALLLRIFATVPAATHFWFWAFWVLAVLTMFAGNLGALVQTNVKRLLAYSSIAHAGYILVAFALVTFMRSELDGAWTRYPVIAAILTLFLLSLLGLPITAGFFGKLYIFKAAVNSHLIWLAVLMAVNSVIGAYYYLRLIVGMYMPEPSPEALQLAPVRFSVGVNVVLVIAILGTLYLGLFPNSILQMILQRSLIGGGRFQ